MTNQEFINEFDLLYNNVGSNQSPGLDNYEKSVFLTKAQEEVLKSYLSKTMNKLGEGVDDSGRRQVDFSTLTKSITLLKSNAIYKLSDLPYSRCFAFPKDAFFIQNETVKVENDWDKTKEVLQVIPLTYNEYTRNMIKPFKQPLKGQAWRIFTGNDAAEGSIIEVIAHYQQTVETYNLRYIRRPHPIILENLGEDSIEGYSYESAGELIEATSDNTTNIDGKTYLTSTLTKVIDDLNPSGITYRVNAYSTLATPGEEVVTTKPACELPEELHKDVVTRAAELAKAYYTGNLQEITALSSLSGTQMGTHQGGK